MPESQSSQSAYLATVNRMERDITPVDDGAYNASAAISLRRIADHLGFFKYCIIVAWVVWAADVLLTHWGY